MNLQILLFLVLLLQGAITLFVGLRHGFHKGYVFFTLVFTLHMLWNFLDTQDWSFPWEKLTLYWSFAYGPAFYLYVRELARRPMKLLWFLPHLLPWSVVLLINFFGTHPWWTPTVLDLHLIFYFFLALVEYILAWRTLPERYSQSVGTILSMVGYHILIYSAILSYDFVARWFRLDLLDFWGLDSSLVTLLLVFLLLASMMVRELTNQYQVKLIPKSDDSPPKQTNLETLAKQIAQKIEQEKLYLDPTLSLDRLSTELGVSTRTCSKAINGVLGTHFADFVNRLRVDEFCHLLRENSQQTLLDLAFRTGFQSKSSFNHTFKRIMGISPSDYKQKISEL